MPPANWLPVIGFEDRYLVSDVGKIRNLRTGRLMRLHNDRKGYPVVGLTGEDGKKINRRVHRIVAEAFIGPLPPGHETCHKDGSKNNAAAYNLEYKTRSGNVLDAVKHGTHAESRRTHCDHGHQYTTENIYVDRHGTRLCKTCLAQRNKAWRERHPEKVRAMRRESMRRYRAKKAQANSDSLTEAC